MQTLVITETDAIVKLQALLDHTADRIVKLQEKTLNFLKKYCEVINLKLIVKWGCDGSSGMSNYKQKFTKSSDTISDPSIFVTSLVPVRLVLACDNNIVLWNNPRSSSSRFCRPICIQFAHETTDLTVEEISPVKKEIEELEPLIVTVGSKIFSVSYDLLFTMIYNKICNAASETSSSQKCYLCQATSKQFNCLSVMLRREICSLYTAFGVSVLHCWIRFFECIIHIAYNLPFEKWQATTVENKKVKEERKKHIQKEFYEKLGLIVDKPKPNYGSSNDGNTARRFFQNYEISSDITGINKNLIKRFYHILVAMSSGFEINVELFRSYCLKTAALYVRLYPWYYMPTSIHKILIHSSDIMERFIVPIGVLSEEAQECRNRDIKRIRQYNSRKCSRKATMSDLFNRLLISSDPCISSQQVLPKSKIKTMPTEVMTLLKVPEVPNYSQYADSCINTISESDSD